jgi:hypothetical protein
MNTIFFWKNWSSIEKTLYWAILLFLVVLSVAFLYFQYEGIANVVRWDVLSELDQAPAAIEQYGGKTLLARVFLLKEQFVPSLMQLPLWLPYVYLVVLGIGLALILAAGSALSRFGYLATMTLTISLLASFQFDILWISGANKLILFGAWIVILGGITYYWHEFNDDVPMTTRILVMIWVVLGLGALYLFLAQTASPALTLASFSVLGVMTLAVAFMVWLSVEVIAAFVYITTNSHTGFGKSSLCNFLFLSGLYLLSILLIYLKNTRRIDGDFWLISPFVWIVASIWLGLWGFRKRIIEHFAFREIGSWLYAGGAFVTLACMVWASLTNNNPMLEVIEDAFIYSQLGVGTLFVVYLFLNFWPIFKAGKEVHKIIYRPMRFVQVQAWAIGLGVSVSCMAFDNFLTAHQGWAAYHNALGDLYTQTGEYKLAEQYYKYALERDYLNQKSNYALASLALQQNDRTTAGAYWQESLSKNPSPQAYAALSQTLVKENLIFDAIFNLRKGIETFPKSGELMNNLGFLYLKINIPDSALYYFDRAEQFSQRPEIATTNQMALFVKNPDLYQKQTFEAHNYNSHQANRQALQLILNQKATPQPFELSLPKDSSLSINNMAYLYNYSLTSTDSTLGRLVRHLTAINGGFYEELQMAQAYADYTHNKLAAFDNLANIASTDTSQKAALVRQTLDFWLSKEAIEDSKWPLPVSFKNDADVFQNLKNHPLNINLLQKVVQYWNTKKQPQKAYDALLNGLRFNRQSVQAQQMYIRQCVKMNYTEFMTDALSDLKLLISATDYQLFLKECERLRAVSQPQF